MGMNVRYLLNVLEVFRKCSRSAGSKKEQLLHIFNSLALARVAEIVHQSVPGSNKISASVKVVFVSVQEINNHDTTHKHFFYYTISNTECQCKHCIFRMPVRSTSQCLNVLPWSTAVRPTWPRPCPVSTSTIGVLILGHSEDRRSIISKLVTCWQGARKYYHCYFFVREFWQMTTILRI